MSYLSDERLRLQGIYNEYKRNGQANTALYWKGRLDSVDTIIKEIVERISLWNPEFQRTSVLLKLLNELTEVLYDTLDLKLDKYIDLRALPVREFFKNVVDKYSAYPIWTCDFEGSCLVGAKKFEIEPIDLILHRFEGE